MKEIIAYAQQHYITIIPEIEMPAHQRSIGWLIRNSPVRVNLIKTQIFVLEMKKHSLS